jgi:hypothetical protein
MAFRSIALLLMLALVVGPLQPLAEAQQPAPATMPAAAETDRGPDMYDVAAPVVTVLKAPFNVALCTIGTGLAAVVFVLTVGSGYKASAWTVKEGCQGPWLIRGEDLRPEPERADAVVGQY